jgi:uncharacterized membrane protein
MDGNVLFLICLFGVWVPILALFRASSALKQLKEVSLDFADLARRCNCLESELLELRKQNGVGRAEPIKPESPTLTIMSAAPSESQPAAPPVIVWNTANAAFPSVITASEDSKSKPASVSMPPQAEPQAAAALKAQSLDTTLQRIDWEQFLGVKLFAWVGALALFLGVGFLVKYSFEQGLISPRVRVAMGLVIGLGLLAGGLLLSRKNYAPTVQALCSAGILILYADIFAACMFYHFLPESGAFLLMALVTTVAFALAVKLDAQAVAVLAMLGGFLTPPLLSTGRDNPMGLFGYLAILDVGLIAVAFRKRWCYLILLAAIATTIMQAGWVEKFFEAPKVETAMTVFLGFAWLFVLALGWGHRTGKVERFVSAAAMLMPGSALFFAFYLMDGNWPSIANRPAWLLSFVFGADLALLAVAWWRSELRAVQIASGGAVFLLLAIWTNNHLTLELLNWALGFYLGFALLHTVFPWALERLRPSASPDWWPPLFAFPPFLLLTMVVLRLPLDDPSSVFGLAAMLLALLLGLVRFGQTEGLGAIGLASIFVLEFNWHFKSFNIEHAAVPLAWYAGFYAVFTLFPFLLKRPRTDLIIAWAVAAASGPAHFFLIYKLVHAAYPNPCMGLIPAAFIVPSLAILVFLLKTVKPDSPHRNTLLALFGGVTLFFFTLIIPIQFERQWITIGWALEGAALLWLFHRVPHEGLRWVGVGLLFISFVRLALNPAAYHYYERSGTPVLNWFLYAYGLVMLSLFVSARLMAPPRNRIRDVNVPPILQGFATTLAFLLLNIDIADYFSTGTTVVFQFSGSFALDMTYSLGWAIFAFALLAWGIQRKSTGARYAGMALLSATLVKLFLHDLWSLGGLYRVGSLIGLALILIPVSFLYQRFLPKSGNKDLSAPSDAL